MKLACCFNAASGHSGSGVAVFGPNAVVAGRVFVPFAEFVADDVVRPAAFWRRWHSAAPSADDPAPVSAGVFGAPGSVVC